MRRWLILLSVVALAFASTATASVQKGDTELEFLGGWFTQSAAAGGGDLDAFFAMGAVGYFVTDNIQVGVVAEGASVDLGGGDDATIYGVGARAKYHFMPTNQWVPYVGGQIMWASVDVGGSVDGMLWGPVLGLRYELNANNDFFAEYQYHLWSGDIGDALDDGHGIFVGIVHQFK